MDGQRKVGIGIIQFLIFLVVVPWIVGTVFITNYGAVTGNLVRYGIVLLLLGGAYIGYRSKGWDFFRLIAEWVDGFNDDGKKNKSKSNGKKKANRPPGYWNSKLIVAVGDQCEFPRCKKTRHLEVHHIDPFAGGGSNRLNNLIVVCPEHHKDFGVGAMNKTRQREYVRRNNRFTPKDFPQQWQEGVLAKEKARLEEEASIW